MDREVITIIEKVLNMPQEQRAFIAERLIESLDMTSDVDIEAAWQKEIHARIAQADRGEAEFLSWEDAKKRLGV